MRRLVLLPLIVVLLLAGCSQRVDRPAFDELYKQTALDKQVLSVVPLRIDPEDPPTVVNWWYAGSNQNQHMLVVRRLIWDEKGKPHGDQKRYKISEKQLKIDTPFDATRDSKRWVPLHEAASELPPPADLPTVRSGPTPKPGPNVPKRIMKPAKP